MLFFLSDHEVIIHLNEYDNKIDFLGDCCQIEKTK